MFVILICSSSTPLLSSVQLHLHLKSTRRSPTARLQSFLLNFSERSKIKVFSPFLSSYRFSNSMNDFDFQWIQLVAAAFCLIARILLFDLNVFASSVLNMIFLSSILTFLRAATMKMDLFRSEPPSSSSCLSSLLISPSLTSATSASFSSKISVPRRAPFKALMQPRSSLDLW
ncbi:hypothetical protein LINGRAHAP2_LOCUS24022 [Linum grandiflorum]